jgi:hypothetical protein
MFQRVRGVGSASLPRLALFPNAALPSAMLARARARTALLGLGPSGSLSLKPLSSSLLAPSRDAGA